MPIKITEINKLYAPWIGGVETHVRHISEGLSQSMSVEVICCNTTYSTKIETIQNIKVTKYSSFGIFFSLPLSISFIVNFKKHAADILHFHLPNPLAVLAYFLTRPKGKVLVTWHSDIIKQKIILFFYRPLLLWFLNKASNIIVTSPNMKDHSPYINRFKHKTHVIPLGIKPEKYGTADMPKVPFSRYALFVGRLIYYKGIIELIEAMHHCSVSVVMIGEGPQEYIIRKKGEQLIKNKRLLIYPFQSNDKLNAFYQHCEFLILPSIHPSEAFGIVQLEAMIYSKPVISTNLPTGVPYVNKHQESGIIVLPKDSIALSVAMQTLWDNDHLRKTLGKNAFHRCINNFTEHQMVSKIVHLIQSMHNGK